MISLEQFMKLVDYRITEGSDFHTTVPGLYMLSSWDGRQDGHSFDIAFDPADNQRVYLVEAHDYANDRAYRIKDAELAVDKQAWDNVDYVDLDVDDDWLAKAQAIKAGQPYDTRISVAVDFSDQELLKYMKMAHERDITFNQLITQALTEAMLNQGPDL